MAAKQVVIIGAGPAGLMAAEVLSALGYAVTVVEQKPSAARKFLMAGKTGLNISHNEPLPQFIQRYDQADWLAPIIETCDATWIQHWMYGLGIQSYVGSSGRIFPVEMKAAPLLRAWLKRLQAQGVKFLYRTRCVALNRDSVQLQTLAALPVSTAAVCQAPSNLSTGSTTFDVSADAIVLACGAVSWPQLGSDGAWQAWIAPDQLTPCQASNVGVLYPWSAFMQPILGQPLKRVTAWVQSQPYLNAPSKTASKTASTLKTQLQSDASSVVHGDIIVSQYGLESGVIYQLNRDLRQQITQHGVAYLHLDLLPDVSLQQLQQSLAKPNKQSLNNLWRKLGLDAAKIALLRDIVPKKDWSNAYNMAQHIKQLQLSIYGFRPIAEAISCAGGVQRSALTAQLQLKQQPQWFCCGEMLDWDAPTGGYLLTACLATGRVAAHGVDAFLKETGTALASH